MKAWMVFRYLKMGSRFVSRTSMMAIFTMMVGVASLLVAMSVVNGFEKSIHESVIDLTGHILVYKKGRPMKQYQKLSQELQQKYPEILAVSGYNQAEALIAKNGRVKGIALRGLEVDTVDQVLKLRDRVEIGEYSFQTNNKNLPALVGKEIVKQFNLKIGDVFQLVLPKPNPRQSSGFSPKLARFQVQGVLNFGKYEYNERIIISSAQAVNQLLDRDASLYNGFRLLIDDKEKAKRLSDEIFTDLGSQFIVKDWYSHNRNFLQAIQVEKKIIFFVVLIMVIAACFNISSSLYISVLKRYGDIGILKSIGASKTFLVQLFSTQALVVCFIGSLLGLLLGLGLCYIIPRWDLFQLPPDVYKLEHIPVDVRSLDVLVIVVTAFVLSFVSSLAPAFRGASLEAVEGLRYE